MVAILADEGKQARSTLVPLAVEAAEGEGQATCFAKLSS
jgi:hypothetical protein